jgi:hypothetical protein
MAGLPVGFGFSSVLEGEPPRIRTTTGWVFIGER